MSFSQRHLAPAVVGLALVLSARLTWAAASGPAAGREVAAEVSHDASPATPPAGVTAMPELKQPGAVQAKEDAKAGAAHQHVAKADHCPAANTQQQTIPRYIGDWDQLSRLAGSDPGIAPMTNQFASRDKFAGDVAKVGILSGLGLGLFGVVSGTSGDSWSKQDKGLAIAGAGVAVLAWVTYWLSMPARSDFLDVINLWNQRHPDLPVAP